MNAHPAQPQVIRTPRYSVRWALELLWILGSHRINLRYKETLLGFGWIFLQPVSMTVIFNYIHKVARIPSGDVPYPLFMATGFVAWTFTAMVVSQTVVSVTGYTAVLKRIALPRILLPFSALLAVLADVGIMGILLIGLLLYYKFAVPATIVWVPVIFFIHFSLLVGLSCLVSLANVFLRDVGHGIPQLLQLWFFASPVFYPSSLVPEEFRLLSLWNPMTGIIEGYRSILLLGRPPPWDLLWPATIVTAVILLGGLLCFRHLEGTIADML